MEELDKNNQSNFMQIELPQNTLKKREQFAVSLRKDKKKTLLNERRKKLSLFSKSDQLGFKEYQGYWSETIDF